VETDNDEKGAQASAAEENGGCLCVALKQKREPEVKEVNLVQTSCRMLIWVMAAAALTFVSPRFVDGSIVGSPHDLSGRGWGTNEICVFCHTPHNAKSPQLAPLWNHTSTTATYTLYSSPTMDQPTLQPRSHSKHCLSCHDGTVAIDSYGSRTGTNFMPGTPGTPGSRNLGTDLSDDHPVSVYWNHQTYNGGNPVCGLNCHTVFNPDAMPFYDRYLECATCHEPHLKYPNPKMLRAPLAGSEICQICHGK
jgi:predicted CXXCH cytochrome family protein